MKTKKASKTTAKSRIVFFAIALTYNLLLGLYLKDFLVLSPMLLRFYLLSVLPTLFLLIDVRSKSMRAIIFVTLFLILLMDLTYILNCRRVILFPTIISLVFEVLYFGAYVENPRKDSFLTKIDVLAVTALIATTLLSTYNFVCKPETPYLSNGRDTLWDTQTEELADKICAGCESDSEKAQAFHNWIVANFEYDYDCNPFFQYFDVRKTLRTQKGLCFDFSHLFAAFCRSQNIPCYVIDGTSYTKSTDRHTWNRVYYDGVWWDVDITCDVLRTKNKQNLYSFSALESVSASDKFYYITKIY
ncbi:MAG: transglutaminase domain-containing protein [Clostridia bacterium]|nr:transglutaminase domain-containing protein [Clostridia bacterium]